MESFSISRDDQADLRFVGEKIVSVGNSPDTARSDYSGSTGRSMDLVLYRTKAGKYVAQRIGYSQWQGERTRYEAAVCSSPAEVAAFFGYGRLAKELYSEAGLDIAEQVD